MKRTSLSLPESLYQRLAILAQNQDQNMSELIRELVEKALAMEEELKLQKIYTGLQQLGGVGDAGITDASITIDEVLYGEVAAWKDDSDEKS